MISLVIALIILILGILIVNQSGKENPKKILKVYYQRGKWFRFKYLFFSLVLLLRRLKYYIQEKSVFYKVEKLEKLQPLSNSPLAFDAVFFHAVSQDGIYFCGGIERRHEGKVVGLVYIVHPDYGVLESEKLPNTILESSISALYKQDCYSGGGMTFKMIQPMKKWRIAFKGPMKFHDNPEKKIEVSFEADWTSDNDWFYFEVDVPISVLARSIATEPWSKQFFQNLKDAHQSHYEQMGYLSGTLEIDGQAIKLDCLNSFRDHSFGYKRDWSLMHRYIYNMFYLSDGTKIAVGVVSQPCTMSHLEMGHVNHPNGRMDPIDKVDLVLYEHGENGILPKQLSFTFRARGIFYEAHLDYLYDVKHYKGFNQEAILYERFSICVVNGVQGRGISEWHYNARIFK